VARVGDKLAQKVYPATIGILSMKNTAVLIIFLLMPIGLAAQGISFGYSRVSSSSTQFRNPVGLHIGYTQPVSPILKINADVKANYSFWNYDHVVFNTATSAGYYVYEVNPDNLWFSLSGSVNLRIISRGCFTWSMGPQISLNYFLINENIHEIPTVYRAERTYPDQYNYLNRLGIGVNFECEFKQIFGNNISIVFSLTPQVVNGRPRGDGILANITQIGLRYNYKNRKDNQ
jgi:hypothetical protein